VVLQAGELGDGLQVRGQADFQGNSTIRNVLHQAIDITFAILDAAVVDVIGVEQPCAMADTIAMQIGQCLED